MTDETPAPKLHIDWYRTLAGALAAMSSAVLLSTLGAAGTLIGAAVGSLAATIGTAVYAQGLVKSKEKVARAQETARLKVGVAQAEVRRARRSGSGGASAQDHLVHAEEQLAEAEADLDDAIDGGHDRGDSPEDEVLEGFPEKGVRPGWRERLALLPWKRIALSAAAAFVVALVAIAVFELVSGRSVSSYTGGSDRDSSSTFTGGNDTKEQGPDQQAPDPVPTDSPDTTDAPESATPSDEPSAELTIEPSQSPEEPALPDPSALPSE